MGWVIVIGSVIVAVGLIGNYLRDYDLARLTSYYGFYKDRYTYQYSSEREQKLRLEIQALSRELHVYEDRFKGHESIILSRKMPEIDDGHFLIKPINEKILKLKELTQELCK